MDVGSLTERLERAALHAVRDEWVRFNDDLFHGAMTVPAFALSFGARTLGRWIRDMRLIELDRALLFERPWTTVCEVLKHEMAHQFVSEILRAHDESAHGTAFRDVCAQRGIDAAATGVPEPEAGDSRHKVIERVAKLLALAASANEHEAHTAMNAAQRLMLEHNIASAAARGRRFVSRELGVPTGRMEEARGLIGVVLSKHFFVQVIQVSVWRAAEGRSGSVLEVTGTPENVAMADYVYAFLDRTAESLWAEHKRKNRITRDSGRRAFRAGVISGFHVKLESERAGHAERGLIWVGDPELAAHYRRRYPRITTARGGGSGSREAREHGREAGRKIVLSRGVEGGGGGSGPRRMLGDGRS